MNIYKFQNISTIDAYILKQSKDILFVENIFFKLPKINVSKAGYLPNCQMLTNGLRFHFLT